MGGLYFSNKLYAGSKLNSVITQLDNNEKIINELQRRKNISKAEKGKTRKRKKKSKGKHRKKKKDSEITITNDPTQQVRGYSVVNVISAKRGPYKKRDTGMSGQESVLSSNIRGRKGQFGRSTGVGGLIQSGSDNKVFVDAAFGQGQDRGEFRALRRQVDRIEQRLAGIGNNPANQNPAGPLNNGLGGNAGGGQNNLGNALNVALGGPPPQPPPAPPQPKGKGKGGGKVGGKGKAPPPPPPVSKPSVLVINKLGGARPVPKGSGGSSLDLEGIKQKALERQKRLEAQKKAQLSVAQPSPKKVQSPKPKQPQSQLELALAKNRKIITGQSSSDSDDDPQPSLRSQVSAGSAQSLRLSIRSSQKGQVSPRSDISTPRIKRSQREIDAEKKFLENQAKAGVPVGTGTNIQSFNLAQLQKASGKASPPVTAASSPPTFVAPQQIGMLAGQSPKDAPEEPTVAGVPISQAQQPEAESSLVASPTTLNPAQQQSKRYGIFNPPPQSRFVARGSKRSAEYYSAFGERRRVENTLKGIIPIEFYHKNREDLRQKFVKSGEIIRWADENLKGGAEGGGRFVREQLNRFKSASVREAASMKRERKGELVGLEDMSPETRFKAAEGLINEEKNMYSIPENKEVKRPPRTPPLSKKPKKRPQPPPIPDRDLSDSGELIDAPPPSAPNPGTQTTPISSATGSLSGLVSTAAGSIVSGAAQTAGALAGGVVSGVASQLPSASDVGRAIGQGAVISTGAIIRGGAGAISGGYQMINAPEPESE